MTHVRHFTRRALGLVCLLSPLGCRSREAEIRESIARSATDIESATSDGIQLAICGFTPGSHVKLRVDQLSLKLDGNEDGTGEMNAVLVGDSGLRCEGIAAFTFARSPEKYSAEHWSLRAFSRVGAPSPVVAAVNARATSAKLGTPVNATLTDDWPLLPRTSAAAFRFEIPRDGRYSFRLPPAPGSDARAWFVAYQGDDPIQDPSGGITEIALVAGTVTILVLAEKPGVVVLDARAVASETPN